MITLDKPGTKFLYCGLFTAVDGIIKEEEVERLNTIADQLGVDTFGRKEVLKHCKSICTDRDTVLREINYVMNGHGPTNELDITPFSFSVDYTPRFTKFNASNEINAHYEMIFNLINLGYCDKECSESELSVIRALASKWEIPTEFLDECFDTEETILMLDNQIEWLKRTSLPSDEVKERIRQVEEHIQTLTENMKTTLRQITAFIGKEK